MSGIDHQCQKESCNRTECRQQKICRYEFHRSRKDKHTHKEWIPYRKALTLHHKSIGHSQEKKAYTDRNRVWKRGFECFFLYL